MSLMSVCPARPAPPTAAETMRDREDEPQIRPLEPGQLGDRREAAVVDEEEEDADGDVGEDRRRLAHGVAQRAADQEQGVVHDRTSATAGTSSAASSTSCSSASPVTRRNTSSRLGCSIVQALQADAGAVEGAHQLGHVLGGASEVQPQLAVGALAVGRHRRQRVVGALGVLRRAELQLDDLVADLALQLLRRALGDDRALADDGDLVGEAVGLLQVLRGEEDGHAQLVVEAPDLLPDRRAARGVEAGGGLVQKEDARVVDERQCEVEPALHAAGVRAGPLLRVDVVEADRRAAGAPPSCAPRRAACRRARTAGRAARAPSSGGRGRRPGVRRRWPRAPCRPGARRRSRPPWRCRRSGSGWSSGS